MAGKSYSVSDAEEKAMAHLSGLFHPLLVVLLTLLLSSCTGSIVSILVTPAFENMQQQSDIALVCEGTPAYLLIVDSMIAADPDNSNMLILGAKAYSGYIGAMQECNREPDRIAAMAEKAYSYGIPLLAASLPIAPSDTMEELTGKLAKIKRGDVPKIFWGTFAWITWIEQQQGAPSAMADLGKLEAILLRIVALEPTFEQGAAHFLLGAYYGSRPKMFGGQPELSRYHFDQALLISQRKMLIYQTTCAQTLARLTMDKKLHDSLLNEVVDFDNGSHRENMLANQIARKRAARLLQENFFADN
jgi:hypothetical protein